MKEKDANTSYQHGPDGREIALENRASQEERLSSPSVARNRDAIRGVFRETMRPEGTVLEIGSGTGEHACHILQELSDLTWQPSDPDIGSRASIDGWGAHLGIDRLRPALDIDVTRDGWWDDIEIAVSAMVSINMIHIAPFTAAKGLFAGAGHLLPAGGQLFLYGPFMRNGVTAQSNREFDRSLKSRDPAWGVRDLDREVAPLAGEHGLSLTQVFKMPANNLSVIFTRNSGG